MKLGRLLSISVLNLGYNQLGHNQPCDGLSFLGSLVNSTHLKILGLGDNDLSGELPNSIVNLSASLDRLELFQNYIYGSIPQEIGKLMYMTLLSLSRNMLTGSIPESVCKLSKLGRVFLEYNITSGVIPACLEILYLDIFLTSLNCWCFKFFYPKYIECDSTSPSPRSFQ